MDCKIPLILAYGMSGYALASISYLAITKYGNIGTPFKDALETYPELKDIRNKSKRKRAKIFLLSIVLAIIIIITLKPFKECNAIKSVNDVQDIFVTQFDQ